MLNRAGIIKLTLLAVATSILYEHFGSVAFVLCGVGLFYLRKEAMSLGYASLTQDSGAIGAIFALGLLSAFCAINPPAAPDDLLRDVASAAYGFDYRKMYPNADIQQYNAYIGFDRFLAWLTQIAGPAGAVHVVQALLFAASLGVLILLCRQSARRLQPEHYALVALCLATPLSTRLFMARPEILFTIWGLSAALAATRLRIAVWAVAGALFTTGYWLAPVYLPFVLLIQARFRTKVAVGAALLGWNMLFWHWASNGTYLESLSLLSSWPKHRVMEIVETGSFFSLFLDPFFLALTLLAGVACSSRKLKGQDFNVLALIAYFMLSGMVRYVGAWVGLLFMLVLPMLAHRRVNNLWLRAGLLFFPVFCACASYGQAVPMKRLPPFTYPQHAYVLTGMDFATFATPFFNRGTVKVAPSMELGANTLSVQNLAAELSRGRLDCNKLRAEPFTHVVENRLQTMPACLKLVAINGSWRQWEVIR